MSGLHTCLNIGDALRMRAPDGTPIVVTVSGKNGRQVKLTIEAPRAVRIERADIPYPNPNKEHHHGEQPLR